MLILSYVFSQVYIKIKVDKSFFYYLKKLYLFVFHSLSLPHTCIQTQLSEKVEYFYCFFLFIFIFGTFGTY